MLKKFTEIFCKSTVACRYIPLILKYWRCVVLVFVFHCLKNRGLKIKSSFVNFKRKNSSTKMLLNPFLILKRWNRACQVANKIFKMFFFSIMKKSSKKPHFISEWLTNSKYQIYSLCNFSVLQSFMCGFRVRLNGSWFLIHSKVLNFYNRILCYHAPFHNKIKRVKINGIISESVTFK